MKGERRGEMGSKMVEKWNGIESKAREQIGGIG
jgi:hypothetical protein